MQLAEALGGLLRTPPPLDLRHMARPRVTVEMRLAHLRSILSGRPRFSFDEAVKGADRLTEAMTVWALLELYKSGEAVWQQDENFGPITVVGASERAGPDRRGAPVPVLGAADRRGHGGGVRGRRATRWSRRSPACASTTPRAGAAWCCARSAAASRSPPTRSPSARRAGCSRARAPRRSRRRRPSAWPSSPTCSPCRGPRSRASAASHRSRPSGTLLERGLIQESGRSQFGAVLYRTTDLFEKLFGLAGLDALPDVTAFDPSPEEEGTLRDRLLKAGEQRAAPTQG